MADLSKEVQERIVADLDRLVVDPRAVDAAMKNSPETANVRGGDVHAVVAPPRGMTTRKLEGKDGNRLRVGDYRVLYDVDKQGRQFVVFWVGDRKDAYR